MIVSFGKYWSSDPGSGMVRVMCDPGEIGDREVVMLRHPFDNPYVVSRKYPPRPLAELFVTTFTIKQVSEDWMRVWRSNVEKYTGDRNDSQLEQAER